MKEETYIHGDSEEERKRLSLMNDVLLNEACFRELRLKGDEVILDVGSGLGQFSRMMGRNAREVWGIEKDPNQMQHAIRLAMEAGEMDLVTFRHGDARALPLYEEEWGTYDLVHTRFVLEHLTNPEKAVHQMVKAAKTGGRIILADDDHAIFRLTPEPPGFATLLKAYCRSYDRIGCDPYIGRRLTTLLDQAGASPVYNTMVFFGGCQGHFTFEVVSNNLIKIIEEAKEVMIEGGLIDKRSFEEGIKQLHSWQQLPDAAIWYALCWAEGIKR